MFVLPFVPKKSYGFSGLSINHIFVPNFHMNYFSTWNLKNIQGIMFFMKKMYCGKQPHYLGIDYYVHNIGGHNVSMEFSTND